jgi:polysaccharide export outer membrane protein
MIRRLFVTLALVILTIPSARVIAQQDTYVIGPDDVLAISVYDDSGLSGQYNVEQDGTLMFPLIGRITAGGLTTRAVEAEIGRLLLDGYLKNPQVLVAVEQYRSQQIFVIGEVRSPGPYQLTGDMTLIEALAMAGSTTNLASDEVLIVRPADDTARENPALEAGADPDDDADVTRVDLSDIRAGTLSQNIRLRDGDTIVVNRAQAVYVFGQVRSPGAYTVEKGATVVQALSLAGGVTDRGSTGRVRINRLVDGTLTEISVELDDIVEPGDTITVPERFF